jgi:hypothetical protein
MPNRPSKAQQTTFLEAQHKLENQGWAIIPNIIPEPFTHKAYEATAQWHRPQTSHGHPLVQIPQIRRLQPVFSQLLSLDIWSDIATLVGAEQLRLLQDVVLIKQSGCQSTVEWHNDHSYTGYLKPDRLFSVRIALSMSTPDNGCLWVLDGSHHWQQNEQSHFMDNALSSSQSAEIKATSQNQNRSPVPLASGDMSIHHCKTFHASFTNESDAPSVVFICHVFDATCQIDSDALQAAGGTTHFPLTKEGNLCPETFPLLPLS